MSRDCLDAVVLHVALDPLTGVWSVMRDLALAQKASQHYAAVGIGVISSSAWPAYYGDELASLALFSYRSRTPNLIGTAQFLWQRWQPPPIDRWIQDLIRVSGAPRAIVHFHNAWMSGAFLPLSNISNETVRTVATMHGMFAKFQRQPIRRHLHRWMASNLIRCGAALTSVDKAGTLQAERLLGIDRDRFVIIRNGVVDHSSRRASKWNGNEAFRLGYLGNLEARKGWEIGAQAAAELDAQGLRVRYFIAGDGPERDRALAWQRRRPNVIEYLGHVSDPRADFLPKLHALVLLSSHEGLPMSIIEALSIGLPVIATEAGGIGEILTDNVNALLVPRSADALKTAVLKLCEQPAEHARIGCEGRRLFLTNFELSRIVQDYHQLYARALTGCRGSMTRTAESVDSSAASIG
jgi:glycosyltransferase involved in cell wall biosynthesis